VLAVDELGDARDCTRCLAKKGKLLEFLHGGATVDVLGFKEVPDEGRDGGLEVAVVKTVR